MKRSARLTTVVLALVLAPAVVLSQGGPAIFLPPNLTTMAPPPAGGTYVDPVFGTTIRRLTDAAGAGTTGIVNEYSRNSAFSMDSRWLLLFWSQAGQYHLYDGQGDHVRSLQLRRGFGLAEPRWSRLHPDILYYHVDNELRRVDVAAATDTLVHRFTSYAAINFGKGEGDLSDRDRVTVVGDDREIFIFDIPSRRSFSALDTRAAPLHGAPWDHAFISPDGDSFVVGFNRAGFGRGRGMEQYDLQGRFVRQLLNAAGHADVGREVDGTPVVFAINSATLPQQPPGWDNAIVKIDLVSGRRTPLLSLEWGLDLHISALAGDGWVYVSTFTGRQGLDPGGWGPYYGEVFRINASGSVVERLAHHRSRATAYWASPRAVISIDGSRLLWSSDFHLSGRPDQYADTYLLRVQGAAPVGPPPPPPTPPGGGGEGERPVTVTRVEADNPEAVTYEGHWFDSVWPGHSGGHAAVAIQDGARVTVRFEGTGVRWIAYRAPWTGMARVTLDGESWGLIDTFAPAPRPGDAVWSATGLERGPHTLVIELDRREGSAAAGAWVWVDAFDVVS